jgi:asparagine synthase (glutamine-hydrolysing)
MLADAAPLSFEERYLSFSSYFSRGDLAELFRGAPECMTPEETFALHRRYFSAADSFSPLSRMLYVDMKTFLPCLNLENMDKTSMAHAVEMRVPFLHEPMADLAATIPDSLKIAGTKRKYILKRSFEGIVPEGILTRKKTGFSVPIRKWIRVDLRERIADRFRSHALIERGFLDRATVDRLLEENSAFRADHALKIWQIYLLDLWFSRFIDAPRFEPAVPREALPIVTDPPGLP